MKDQEIPQATLELLDKLRKIHPEFNWGTFPLTDYDQYSIGSPPELLICFSHDEITNCEEIPDAFSTFYGEQCAPSHWKLTVKAAELIRDHNQIAVAGPIIESTPLTKFNQELANGTLPKQLDRFPDLACPKCERNCKPQRHNKDGSVAYSCPADHEHHGNTYTWRIAQDGTLID